MFAVYVTVCDLEMFFSCELVLHFTLLYYAIFEVNLFVKGSENFSRSIVFILHVYFAPHYHEPTRISIKPLISVNYSPKATMQRCYVMMHLVVLIQHRLVTDGQTDRTRQTRP